MAEGNEPRPFSFIPVEKKTTTVKNKGGWVETDNALPIEYNGLYLVGVGGTEANPLNYNATVTGYMLSIASQTTNTVMLRRVGSDITENVYIASHISNGILYISYFVGTNVYGSDYIGYYKLA